MSEINTTKKKDMFLVDPRNIIIEYCFNTRTSYTEIDELASSIESEGIKIPLRGFKRGDNYVLTDGHRRMMAVKLLSEKGIEIHRVPFIPEKITTIEARTFEILLSNGSVPLTPLELANTYKRLISYGFTPTEISKRTGKSTQHIRETLELTNITENTAQLITSKTVSANAVKTLLKSNSPEETEQKIISAIGEKDLTGKPLKKSRQISRDLNKKLTKEDADSFKLIHEQDATREQLNDLSERLKNQAVKTDNSAVKLITVYEYGQFSGDIPKGKVPGTVIVAPTGFVVESQTHTNIKVKKNSNGTDTHFLYN